MTDPKPLRVSWSAIRTHEECQQRSHLIREGRRAKVINGRNFFAGTVVDLVMRDWLDNPLRAPGTMINHVNDRFDQTEIDEKASGNIIRWRNAADRDDVRTFCITLVTRLEPLLAEHVLPHPYEHGKWFKVPMRVVDDRTGTPRDIVLTGEMDLIVDNGGTVIWDLKGTADNEYWRKVVGQLTFYDLAVWASSGTKTRHVGLIQPMCDERIKTWTVDDTSRRVLMNRIVRYANDVWATRTACTTDTSTCHWCDVKHACPRFRTTGDVFGDLAATLRDAAEQEKP